MTNALTIIIIASCLYYEGAGETWQGKVMIASVVQNERTATGRSWHDVCLNPSRYSAFRRDSWSVRRNMRRQLKRREPEAANAWQDCLKLAEQMAGGTFVPIGRMNHYFNPSQCCPFWGVKMQDVVDVGKHRFGWLAN